MTLWIICGDATWEIFRNNYRDRSTRPNDIVENVGQYVALLRFTSCSDELLWVLVSSMRIADQFRNWAFSRAVSFDPGQDLFQCQNIESFAALGTNRWAVSLLICGEAITGSLNRTWWNWRLRVTHSKLSHLIIQSLSSAAFRLGHSETCLVFRHWTRISKPLLAYSQWATSHITAMALDVFLPGGWLCEFVMTRYWRSLSSAIKRRNYGNTSKWASGNRPLSLVAAIPEHMSMLIDRYLVTQSVWVLFSCQE
jgi:hypothetical protein